MVLIQVMLGVITIVFIVPVFFASLHQVGAIILFTIALWTTHHLLYGGK